MANYNHKEIEAKWQKAWKESKIYQDYSKEKKFYALDMFPYPSGAGLHVGHPKGYIATDVVSRFKMLNGFSVLHPMGWDAFGLPAENYAIKNKVHPRVAVEKNVARYKEQLQMFGFTYDWEREIDTTDPEYYRWTQWIFLKMFEKGLAFESNEPVNWCPSCKTVLANEDLEGGVCERCGTQVEQKKLRQWVLKMTDYADRLLYDLDTEDLDWEDMILDQQRNWIGRSEGAEFFLPVILSASEESNSVHKKLDPSTPFRSAQDDKLEIGVYTTRLDTVFGMTYAVVAPEHEIIQKLKDKITNYKEVEAYIIKAQNKSALERTELQKEKTGVELKGIKVENPFTRLEIPLFVGDYVLGNYGTGAVMAVPAHDERDWDFAKAYKLPVKFVVHPTVFSYQKSEDVWQTVENIFPEKDKETNDWLTKRLIKADKPVTVYGKLINSDTFTGLHTVDAIEKLTKWLEEKKIGKRKVNYKMRDWVFSRQRYWGEPIPIIHCEKCGAVGVPESELPLKLPEVENYEPTGTGESPLANISEWVNTKCPKCGGPAKRETNTMPQWAGSCWYYLRYIDNKNDKALIDINKEKEWMPVDLYVGGAEHATRHLLYARFWHKFLFDIGAVSTKEPFKRLVHVGLINAEDGRKMSKRWNNVINPDEIIEKFGADSIRLYEMFMGPFTQNIAWSTNGVIGVRRFLEKVWDIYQNKKATEACKCQAGQKCDNAPEGLQQMMHKTIKKVTEDIENFRFNTAISQMMIFVNFMSKLDSMPKNAFDYFAIILSPFAPHMAEELWAGLGNKESVFKAEWPKYDPAFVKDETVNLVLQVNGKNRDTVSVDAGITEEEAKKLAMENEIIKKWLDGKTIVKVIFVKDKLVNIVIK